MKAAAALLAALAAIPAAGQAPPCDRVALEVDRGSLVTLRGVTLAVRGGQYLTEETARCVAKELDYLRAQNAALKAAPVVTPPAFIVAVSVAFVLGAGTAAYLVTR
jgi:hypothetical protein